MPFVAIPNAARVDIFVDAYHMVMGVAKVSPSPLSGADCLTAATAVFNSTSSDLMPSLSDQSSLKSVTVTALDTMSSPQAIYAPGNVAGGEAGKGLPPQAALCVAFYTALRSRRGRGRVYIPAWTTDHMSIDGVPLPSALTAALAWFDSMKTALLAASPSMNPVVISRLGANFHPITDRKINRTVFTTQRRREYPQAGL